ncbi:MAG: zinc-ribbon and DUF3426 domain-containing protein [Betaproteobacteria bacterium]
MLLTTCPNCSAQFKVQPEQLNVRQGRVMCGRCRNVFNAFQSLTRVPEDSVASHQSPPAVELSTGEPLPNLTDALFLREEPLPLSMDFSQSDFAADNRIPAPAEVAFDVDHDPSVAAEGLHEISSRALPSLLPTETELTATTDENPLLAPPPGHRVLTAAQHPRIWTWGAAVLFLTLGFQIVYAYRSTINQAYPPLRPHLVSICDWVGCNLSWGRDDNAIRIEASDLIETPGKAGQIQLTATLVNRGVTRQDLPAMELKLTDNANQVIVSRILMPHEYLGRLPDKDESLIPNVEMYVNLNIELTNKAQASGYGVRAFYN